MHRLRAVFVLCLAVLAGCGTLGPHENAMRVSVSPVAVPPLDAYVTMNPPPAPTDVWEVVRSGFALNHETQRPSVIRAIDAYRTRDSVASAVQARGPIYFSYVVDAVRQRDLPMELALLPIVESTLNPYAVSRKGAAGLWQLVPATARQQGLTIDWWYDGRRDLLDSTDAALNYLVYLHDEFDDWLLAIAAYNAGEGRVRRALAQSPGSGFFELKMPRETQRYIARLLGLAHLISEDDGVVLPPIAPEPPFFIQTMETQIDLETLTSGGELPLDELFRFNPGLNRRATPPDRPYRLLVPHTCRTAFVDAVNGYPPEAARWQRHSVSRGESLSSIAKRYHTSVAAIRTSNALTNNLIRPNQSLLVPSVAAVSGTLAVNPMLIPRGQWHHYRTHSGDSLWSISRKFNTSITALVRANQIDSAAQLAVGQVLLVPASGSTHRMTYVVQRGDSLARIAHAHDVSVAEILAWNNMDPSSVLQPGLRLVLHVRARDWS